MSLNPGRVSVCETERVKQERSETANQIEGLSGWVYQLYLARVTVCLCVGVDCILCAFLTIVDTLITEKQQS